MRKKRKANFDERRGAKERKEREDHYEHYGSHFVAGGCGIVYDTALCAERTFETGDVIPCCGDCFEGVIRVAIFLIYIFLISRTKDIKRTFMYHGAEHKCINCIEHGLELNVENVRKSSKQHKRCGTSFLFFVMIVSVIFCFFITAQSQVMRIVIRLALLPLIAGVSYEIIKLAGNSDNPVVNLLSKPGMWVQNMTTKEPDDSMIEVAICAVEKVFDWREWQEKNNEL